MPWCMADIIGGQGCPVRTRHRHRAYMYTYRHLRIGITRYRMLSQACVCLASLHVRPAVEVEISRASRTVPVQVRAVRVVAGPWTLGCVCVDRRHGRARGPSRAAYTVQQAPKRPYTGHS